MRFGIFFTKIQRQIFIGCLIISSVALFVDAFKATAYGAWLFGLPFICFSFVAYALHGKDEKDVASRIINICEDNPEINDLDFADALLESLTNRRSFSELKKIKRSNEYIAWFFCARNLKKEDLAKIPKPQS